MTSGPCLTMSIGTARIAITKRCGHMMCALQLHYLITEILVPLLLLSEDYWYVQSPSTVTTCKIKVARFIKCNKS